MTPRNRSLLLSVPILVCCLPWFVPAHAALGGNAGSVLEDVDLLHGTSESSFSGGFEVIEITTDNGLRVREYLAPAGTLFGIAWNGPVMPDLRQLLGSRFTQYTAALRAQDHPGRHRVVALSVPGLVVQSAGHLRAYSGRAYLPAAMPDGIAPALIR